MNHPALSSFIWSKAELRRGDYKIVDGCAALTAGYAMLFYIRKRLGLREGPWTRDSRTQHIVAADVANGAAPR
ncbi:hypothetical protein R69749_02186 [Paraburkholderia domus]|nr:hypothetical protein R69749_02186 [Paraburkholderia domus]